MADDLTRRRKIRSTSGRVGVVMSQLSRDHVSVQFHRNGMYLVCRVEDLEDISEDEFRRGFR